MPFRLECRPAFDYARGHHETHLSEHGARFDGPGLSLGLASTLPLARDGAGVTADFTLGEGESTAFLLRLLDPDRRPRPLPGDRRGGGPLPGDRRLLAALARPMHLPWAVAGGRPALGPRAQAPDLRADRGHRRRADASLPEGIGGRRNWDYRYTWIRDAAFTLYAFLRIGFTEEATRFMDWLEARWREGESSCAGPLQLMYGVDGRSELAEEELAHLEGYRESRPVRIGNGASSQLQLDIYGELMDSVYLHNKYAAPVGYDAWSHLRKLVDWVCDNWGREDEGVWEVRGGRRHFVYSKFMSWVAIDRGLRLADKRSFPADRARWLAARDAIYEEVMDKGWDAKRQRVRPGLRLGGAGRLGPPDAARLLHGAERPADARDRGRHPKALHTRGPRRRRPGLSLRLAGGRGRVRLGRGDVQHVQLLAGRGADARGRTDPGRLDDARLLFEQVLGYANHLGLYAEQTGPSGEALGNFPQAFTHLALISAAFNLDRVLGGAGRA